VSVPKPRRQRSFFDASFLVDELFGPQDPYRLFREKVLPALWRERGVLARLYCEGNGRPAIEPVVMAAVTVLQFMEKVTDRKAVEMVRLHLGWKYALDLELDYAGFHPTDLVVFRQRLLAGGQERLVFDVVLAILREAGLIRKRSKVRVDSTHVVAVVAKMNRLEVVRESLRLALGETERQGMQGSVADWDVFVERYRDSHVDWRRQTKGQLIAKFAQAGHDALRLIVWARGQALSLGGSEKMLVLERVFLEQYELGADGPRPREKEGSRTIKNPHEPEAQWSTKNTTKDKSWVGYKVQVEETVPEDGKAKPKGEPTEQFITDVVTTEAVASDIDGMHRMAEGQAARGESPARETYVDSAYVSGETLAAAQAQGRELVGPALPSQKHKGKFATKDFDIAIAARKARCPAGKSSSQCSLIHDSHQGRAYYRFEWGAQCDACPLRPQCTGSRGGRRTVSVGIHHDLLQRRRREMETDAFRTRLRQRNAIEGTISELARAGLRHTRYRGLAKTALANYFIATACNVRRWFRRLTWQAQCAPAAS
jgi:transposase